jgi:plastocyanin
MKVLCNFFSACAVCLAAIGTLTGVRAADLEVHIAIKDHKFEPSEIKVPAQQRIKLQIQNQDTTPEEFESHSLKREKVIPGGGKALISIGPLKPGRYTFFGEFHPATATGVLIAE